MEQEPTKAALRATSITARGARRDTERADAAEAIAQHVLALPAAVRARRVACYLSMPSEPGTGPLVEGLLARGVEVVVPLSRDDGTLEWVVLDPSAPVRRTSLGIPEPDGDVVPDALASCDLVLLPALAVDHAGRRLGRGAGYYDRALEGSRALRCALVFTDELVPVVPSEPHDVPVDLVVTPAGTFRVPHG